MSMTNEQLNRLMTLCGALRDGVITPEEFSELNEMLRADRLAREYYLDYAYLCADLCHFQSATQQASVDLCSLDPCTADQGVDPAITLDMLKALAEYEIHAEALSLPEPDKVILAKAPVEKVPHKISKLSIVTFVTSLAAMLIMIGYVYLNPRTAYEVATMTDSIGSQWTSSLPLQKGVRLLASSEPIELQRGTIKIESDKGVHIVLEAPAAFNFVSPDEVVLHHGRLVAYVPERGNGFSVQTQNSKIIDLGTKFGVYADMKGETELHMFKGKTLLIAGQEKTPRKTTEVTAGRALHIDYTGQGVRDVPLRDDVFAHDIDSQTGLLWRGQKEINLADVVGGGNGLGTGGKDVGINPATGDYRTAEGETRRQANTFILVTRNIFVDGVFVPSGGKEQVVSSAGHIFAECPATSRYFFADIVNTPSSVSHSSTQARFPLYLGDVNYSLAENPCILIHSNSGITFDLSQYRSRLPGAKIARFVSDVGISDSAPKSYTAAFWVLVDGQVRHHNAEPMRQGNVENIAVELGDKDRFLTLVVTDGGVYDVEQDRNGIGYDWCVFGRPVLKLE